MIYSEWQPEGGFLYFSVPDISHPIGDDLPVPKMPKPSGGIGVPAQDAGYPLPPGAELVGEGTHPKGVMTKMNRHKSTRGLGQATKLSNQETVVALAMLFILGAAAYAGRNA